MLFSPSQSQKVSCDDVPKILSFNVLASPNVQYLNFLQATLISRVFSTALFSFLAQAVRISFATKPPGRIFFIRRPQTIAALFQNCLSIKLFQYQTETNSMPIHLRINEVQFFINV